MSSTFFFRFLDRGGTISIKKDKEDEDDDEPKCYSHAGLGITRCLANSDVVKWSPENILERGEILLRIWMKESDVEVEKKIGKLEN